jgi:hypothetical protein
MTSVLGNCLHDLNTYVASLFLTYTRGQYSWHFLLTSGSQYYATPVPSSLSPVMTIAEYETARKTESECFNDLAY